MNDALPSPARRGLLAKGWRNLRAAGPRRLWATALLLLAAGLLAMVSWSLPVFGDAERALYDLRAFLAAPRAEQDPRIQLVVYDDQTLIEARKRSPLDRGLLARALRNLDAMGAKAIGIDILFDQVQDEDDELIATLRAMKTPVSVGYTNLQSNRDDITYEQQQYLDAFVARLAGSRAHPASIQLDYAHGVTRNWPRPESGRLELLSRSMLKDAGEAQAKNFAGYTGTIRYRIAADEGRPEFSSLRIDLFADPTLAEAMRSQIEGRYVLIGGDIVDTDRVETTLSSIMGQSVPGIQVHAAMIAQMLDGAALHPLPFWGVAGLTVLVLAMAAMSGLLELPLFKAAPLIAGQLAIIGGLPFLLQQHGTDTQGLPAFGWIAGWIMAYAAVGAAARASGAEQRRFAHAALGKYLPRDIAQQIIDNPELLALKGTKQNLYILFSDLEGFTKLAHALPPETVAKLLNDYLEKLSQVVLDRGGVIDKFVGDAVIAFWGAPIARADDAQRAADAATALWQAGEEFRRSVDPSLPPIGKTRVGLHYGEAIVGNFGGESRIQYTALGDSMNTASRLESANKPLGTSVLASGEFITHAPDAAAVWRPMGKVVLRGRSRPVEIFEFAPQFPAEDRAALQDALALSDPDAAATRIAELAARFPQDSGLQNLAYRMSHLPKGEAYVLE